MTKSPKKNLNADKAFNICLLTPVNDKMHQTTLSIEVVVDLMQAAKSEENFQKAFMLLNGLRDHQIALARHLDVLVTSIAGVVIPPPEKEPVVPPVSNVH